MTTSPQIGTGAEGEKSPREIALEAIRAIETPTSVDEMASSLKLVLKNLKEGLEGETPKNPVIREALNSIGAIREKVSSDYDNEAYVAVASDKDGAVAAKLEEKLDELVLYYEIIREEAETLLGEGNVLVNNARVKLMLSRYEPGADVEAAVVVLPEDSRLNLEKERQVFEGKVQEHFKAGLSRLFLRERKALATQEKIKSNYRGAQPFEETYRQADLNRAQSRVDQVERYMELYDRVLGPMMAKEVVDRFEAYVLAKYDDDARKIEVLRTVYGGNVDNRRHIDHGSEPFRRKTIGFNGFRAGDFEVGKANEHYGFGIYLKKDHTDEVDMDLASDLLFYFRELDKANVILMSSLSKGRSDNDSLIDADVIRAYEVSLGFIHRAFVETANGGGEHIRDVRHGISYEFGLDNNDPLRAWGEDLRYIALMNVIESVCLELGINREGIGRHTDRKVELFMSAEAARLNVQTRDEFHRLYTELGRAIEEGYGEEMILTFERALAEIRNLKGERAEVEERFRSALGGTREELDGALGTVDTLERDLEVLVGERDEYKERAGNAEQEALRIHKEQDGLKRENDTLKKACNELGADVRRLQGEKEDLEGEKVELEKEIRDMKKELEALRFAREKALESLEGAKASLFGKNGKIDEAIETLKVAENMASIMKSQS